MKNTLLTVAMVLSLFSCKKEDPLPAATRSGANTFGCKVAGKVWVPDGGGGFSGIKAIEGGIGVSPVNPYLYNVLIRTYRSDKTKIDLYIRGVSTTGVYRLNSDVGVWPSEIEPRNNYGAYYPTPSKALVTNPRYTGTVTVTRADTASGIVSGSFEFTVYDPDSKQTIRVTDGRFDVDSRK